MIRCNETDVAHPIATVRFLYIPHADIKSACFFCLHVSINRSDELVLSFQFPELFTSHEKI